MKKEVISTVSLGLFLLLIMFISGCEGIDISQLSDEDLERISEKAIVCNAPYIRYAADCCLDQNDNKICDRDERHLTPEEKDKEDKINIETPSGIKPPVKEPPAEPTKTKRFKDDKLSCLDTFEDYLEYTVRDASEEELLSLDKEIPEPYKENLIEAGLIEKGEIFTNKDYHKLLWELQEKEYKECLKEQDKNDCIIDYVRENKNICLCDDIKDDDSRNRCYFGLKKHYRVPELCEKITVTEDYPYRTECYDFVYRDLAIKNFDTSYCVEISTQEGIDSCYDKVYQLMAFENKDPSFCGKINDIEARDSCYVGMTVGFDEIDICTCGLISPSPQGKFGKIERCLLEAAGEKGLVYNKYSTEEEICKRYEKESEIIIPEHNLCHIEGEECGKITITQQTEQEIRIILDDIEPNDILDMEGCQIYTQEMHDKNIYGTPLTPPTGVICEHPHYQSGQDTKIDKSFVITREGKKLNGKLIVMAVTGVATSHFNFPTE